MGRIYVPSTPASRGEPVEAEQVAPLTVEEVTAAAEALGFRLVPLEATEAEAAAEVPAGNASREDWADYARACGAGDDDLVDADGKPLGRDALRDRYAPPADGSGDG